MALSGKRAGRPRPHNVKVWLSAAELDAVQARAGDAPLSGWLRDLALGEAPAKRTRSSGPAPKADPALVAQVAKIGNNLNQMARALNECRLVGDAVQLVEVAAQLAAVRADLLSLLPQPRSGQGGGDAD